MSASFKVPATLVMLLARSLVLAKSEQLLCGSRSMDQ